MDDFNIYDDLELLQLQENKKEDEQLQWKEKYKVSLGTIGKLQAEKKELNKKIKQLEVNFASLLETARSEIKRKDNQITQLRREKDNICFRRNVRPSKNQFADEIGVDDTRREGVYVNPFSLKVKCVATKTSTTDDEKSRPSLTMDGIAGEDARNDGGYVNTLTLKTKNIATKNFITDEEKNRPCWQVMGKRQLRSGNSRERGRSRDASRAGCEKIDRGTFRKSRSGNSSENEKIIHKNRELHRRRGKGQSDYEHERFGINFMSDTQSSDRKGEKPQRGQHRPSHSTDYKRGESTKKSTNGYHHRTSSLDSHSRDKRQPCVKSKQDKPSDSKTKNGKSDPVEKASVLQNLEAGNKTEALEKEILIDVKEYKKIKQSEIVQEINIEENASKVAKEKSNNFLDALFDDMIINGEEEQANNLYNDLPKVILINDKTAPKKATNVDENSNVEIQVRTPLKQSVTKLLDDLFGPSPAGSNISTVVERKTSVSPVGELSSDTVEFVPIVTDDKKKEEPKKGASESNLALSKQVDSVKVFQFAELDSSFYSSEDDAEVEITESQNDIDSPPFEKCLLLKKDLKPNVLEPNTAKELTVMVHSCQNSETVVLTNNPSANVPPQRDKEDKFDKPSNLIKMKQTKASRHSPIKSEKKMEKIRNDSHSHRSASKHSKSSSSSRSRSSSGKDSYRHERHRHENEKPHSTKSSQDNRKRSSKSSRKHSKDSRSRFRHKVEENNNIDASTANLKDPELQLVWSEEKTERMSSSLKQNKDKNLMLCKDQVIGLQCEDISDEEGVEAESQKGSDYALPKTLVDLVVAVHCDEVSEGEEVVGGQARKAPTSEEVPIVEMSEISGNRGENEISAMVPSVNVKEINCDSEMNVVNDIAINCLTEPLEILAVEEDKSISAKTINEIIVAESTNNKVMSYQANELSVKCFEERTSEGTNLSISKKLTPAQPHTSIIFNINEDRDEVSDVTNLKASTVSTPISSSKEPYCLQESGEVSSSIGRRRKLKTPRKVANVGTLLRHPCSIDVKLANRLSKSDDGGKQKDISCAHLRRANSTSDLADVPETGTQKIAKQDSRSNETSIHCICVEEEPHEVPSLWVEEEATEAPSISFKKLVEQYSTGSDRHEPNVDHGLRQILLTVVCEDSNKKSSPAQQEQVNLCNPLKETSTPEDINLTILELITESESLVSTSGSINNKKETLEDYSRAALVVGSQDTPNSETENKRREVGCNEMDPINSTPESIVTSSDSKITIASTSGLVEENNVVHKDTPSSSNVSVCLNVSHTLIVPSVGEAINDFPLSDSALAGSLDGDLNEQQIATADNKRTHNNKIIQGSRCSSAFVNDNEPILQNLTASVREAINDFPLSDSALAGSRDGDLNEQQIATADNKRTPNYKIIEGSNCSSAFVNDNEPIVQNLTASFCKGLNIKEIQHRDLALLNERKLDSIDHCDSNYPPNNEQDFTTRKNISNLLQVSGHSDAKQSPLTCSSSVDVNNYEDPTTEKQHVVPGDTNYNTPTVQLQLIATNVKEALPSSEDDCNSAGMKISSDEYTTTVITSNGQVAIETADTASMISETVTTSMHNKKYKKNILHNSTSSNALSDQCEKEDIQKTPICKPELLDKKRKRRNKVSPDCEAADGTTTQHKQEVIDCSDVQSSAAGKKKIKRKLHILPDSDKNNSASYKNKNQQAQPVAADKKQSTKTNNPEIQADSTATCESGTMRESFKQKILQDHSESEIDLSPAENILSSTDFHKSQFAAAITGDFQNKQDSQKSQYLSVKDPKLDSIQTNLEHFGNKSTSPVKEFRSPAEIITISSPVNGQLQNIRSSPIKSNIPLSNESPSDDAKEHNSISIKRKIKPSKHSKKRRKLSSCSSDTVTNSPIMPSTNACHNTSSPTATGKRKRSLTLTNHNIFQDDLSPADQNAFLPLVYNANGEDVQYEEIDNRMRSIFQSPTYPQTNAASTHEAQVDISNGDVTVDETLNQSDKSQGDTSLSSRKVSLGSNDYFIEVVGTNAANVFVTRRKCKKRLKAAKVAFATT